METVFQSRETHMRDVYESDETLCKLNEKRPIEVIYT